VAVFPIGHASQIVPFKYYQIFMSVIGVRSQYDQTFIFVGDYFLGNFTPPSVHYNRFVLLANKLVDQVLGFEAQGHVSL
jgi:hypothetical protein